MRYLTILLCLFASSANAQFFSGNDLYALCGKRGTFIEAFVAGVYDQAVVDHSGIDFIRKSMSNPKFKDLPRQSEQVALLGSLRDMVKPYCLPRGATVGQLGEVFCKYLRENPAKRAGSSALLAKLAFAEAWPCQSKGPVE
jgi:hypothetical protein